MAGELVGAAWGGMVDEVILNFRGRRLLVVSAPGEAKAEDVLGFARFACGGNVVVRLAGVEQRPERWQVNPLRGRAGGLWCVLVDEV